MLANPRFSHAGDAQPSRDVTLLHRYIIYYLHRQGGGGDVSPTVSSIRRDRDISSGCLFQRRNYESGATPAVVNFTKREKQRQFLSLPSSATPSLPFHSLVQLVPSLTTPAGRKFFDDGKRIGGGKEDRLAGLNTNLQDADSCTREKFENAMIRNVMYKKYLVYFRLFEREVSLTKSGNVTSHENLQFARRLLLRQVV